MGKDEEKQFFDTTFETKIRKPVLKFYKICKNSRDFYRNFLLSNCSNKKVLEYGCGEGSYAFLLSRHGAEVVVGIDISEVGIQNGKARAKREGLENIEFLIMDAEAMQFEDSSFDLVCGTSILHHLQMDKALKELARVLWPEGKAIFIEPMAYNPAISLFRKLTPHFRTRDEHPLTNKDLELIEEFFHQIKYNFWHLTSFLAVPFRNIRGFSSLLKTLDSLDKNIFEWIPLLRLLAWQVIIILERPKKDHFQ